MVLALNEAINVSTIRAELEKDITDFLIKLHKVGVKKVSGVVIAKSLEEYLRPIIDKLFAKYPFEYKTENGDIQLLPKEWYRFSIVDTGKLGKDLDGAFYGEFDHNALTVNISIALPSLIMSLSKDNIDQLTHMLTSTIIHEINHYVQHQHMGWKWFDQLIKDKKSKFTGNDTPAGFPPQYLLNQQEIDSFAIDIAHDIIAAVKRGDIQDIKTALSMLASSEGISSLQHVSGMLSSYFTTFVYLSELPISTNARLRLLGNLYKTLLKKVAFHIQNYDNQLKGMDQVTAKKVQAIGNVIRKTITW